jgi:hypothetical protein
MRDGEATTPPLRVAYIGPNSGTSLHRARAMERLGHSVTIIDPGRSIPKSKWVARWMHRTGGIGVGALIDTPVFNATAAVKPNLIWVDQGAYLGPRLIKKFRSLSAPIINYTIDDPFGGRDGRRFDRYFKALPYYDLLAVMRDVNIAEARAYGVRDVIRVWMTADEAAHKPRHLSAEDQSKWSSEICFIGTWMPERGPLMKAIVLDGLPLSIWGNRWEYAPEWPVLAPHWRGPGVYDDDSYAHIIQSAKICLGLVSKGNRDGHTTRSMEIPALGGLLCAERTDEHIQLYDDSVDAVFWETIDECKAICRKLLADETARQKIARAGFERQRSNGKKNENVIAEILARVNIYNSGFVR